jgi:hypothetical protein
MGRTDRTRRLHPTWGGRRLGAGRKPGPNPGVPHRARPGTIRRPALVVLRRAAGLPSLSAHPAVDAVRAACAPASSARFRLLHVGVEPERLLLVVQPTGREALIRGVQGLSIRVARAVNRAARAQ